MVGQVFSDREIQNAFRLAYVLHPSMAVAYSVALDAIDRFFLQKRLQGRRPKAKTQPFKNLLSDAGLLQTSVYLASDIWERDQERLLPRKTIFYEPNVSDLIARYVKLLVWKTMEHSCTYVAVGIGTFLYTYRTSEIKNLAPDHIKEDNIRRVKAGIVSEIRNRFERYNIAPDDSTHIITRAPTSHERKLVHNSLAVFAPWVAEHVTPSSDSTPILETYFGYESEKSEWERNHALIDFECAGIRQLIQEFNASVSREDNMRLEDPDEKLQVPDFGTSFDSGGSDNRFNPPSLSETELISLRRALAQNERRRELYRPGRVRVSVDGKEQELTLTDSTADDEFTVSSSASYIEVYGDDPSGELLLAVVPLTKLELDLGKEVEVPIKHNNELLFSLFISRDSESDDFYSVRLCRSNPAKEMPELVNPSIDDDTSSNASWVETGRKREFQRSSRPVATSVQKLLWFLAGAESQILVQDVCVTERSKYSLIGTGVLISSVIAALAGGYAFLLLWGSVLVAVTFGLTWGIVILTFDRFLVLSLRVTQAGHLLTRIAPRLLLAIFVGLIVSEFVVLRVFKNEVNSQVELQRQEFLIRAKENAKDVFSEIDELEDNIARWNDEVRVKTADRDRLYQELIHEQIGRGDTGKLGTGPIAQLTLKQLRTVESELYDLRWKNEKQIENYNNRLEYLRAERDKEIARISVSVTHNGLLSHLSGLARLKESNDLVRRVSWFLLLLVTFVEAMPVLMKASFASGLYEEVLRSVINYDLDRYRQELATRPEREVDEKIEDLKNVVKLFSHSRRARSQVI